MSSILPGTNQAEAVELSSPPSEAYAKLESSLYGALLHISHVAAHTVGAPLTITRVFGNDDRPTDTAWVGHLQLSGRDRQEIERWAAEDASLFSLIEDDFAEQPPLRQLPCTEEVWPLSATKDVWCLHVPIREPMWAAMVICHDTRVSAAAEHHRQLLKLRPEMARLLSQAWQRDCQTHGIPSNEPATKPTAPELADYVARLSRTERLVLHHLGAKRTEREIGEIINRSPHTVHVHVKNIYRKLNVTRRKQLLDLLETQPMPHG